MFDIRVGLVCDWNERMQMSKQEKLKGRVKFEDFKLKFLKGKVQKCNIEENGGNFLEAKE